MLVAAPGDGFGICLQLSGEIDDRIGDRTIECLAGDLLFIDPLAASSGSAISPTRASPFSWPRHEIPPAECANLVGGRVNSAIGLAIMGANESCRYSSTAIDGERLATWQRYKEKYYPVAAVSTQRDQVNVHSRHYSLITSFTIR